MRATAALSALPILVALAACAGPLGCAAKREAPTKPASPPAEEERYVSGRYRSLASGACLYLGTITSVRMQGIERGTARHPGGLPIVEWGVLDFRVDPVRGNRRSTLWLRCNC